MIYKNEKILEVVPFIRILKKINSYSKNISTYSLANLLAKSSNYDGKKFFYRHKAIQILLETYLHIRIFIFYEKILKLFNKDSTALTWECGFFPIYFKNWWKKSQNIHSSLI